MIPLSTSVVSLVDLEPAVLAPTALPDRLYALLKHRILTCVMHPGQRIVERDICKEMAVSRTPLREALNRLVLEGIVVLVPYRGYAVAPVTVTAFLELCEVRRIIESDAAALAAVRASPAQLAALRAEANLTYTPGDPATYVAYLQANSRFHRVLVRCTGNSLLEAIVTSALERHQRPLYLGMDIGVDAAAATREHLELVDALERRDESLARRIMVQHVTHAESQIAAALRAAGFS